MRNEMLAPFGARYRLLELLGRGGFGEVFLAEDLYNGIRVAIKVLANAEPDALRRFAREVRLLWSNLDNPHVVTVYDWDLEHDTPYLVMEYCDGGSLRGWVETRRTWPEIVEALRQVARGLEEIHAGDGFHRDIKPDNLLVCRASPELGTPTVKVADFGLARNPLLSRGPMTRHAAGTDGYIAPEVLQGAAFSDRADVYSLGVVATELLTGRCDERLIASTPMPALLRQFILRMRALEPSRRPTLHQIERVLDELLTTRPHSCVPAQRIPAKKQGLNPLWVVGGALFGGFALAALAGAGDESWDSNVQRYRGSDGRFRRG